MDIQHTYAIFLDSDKRKFQATTAKKGSAGMSLSSRLSAFQGSRKACEGSGLAGAALELIMTARSAELGASQVSAAGSEKKHHVRKTIAMDSATSKTESIQSIWSSSAASWLCGQPGSSRSLMSVAGCTLGFLSLPTLATSTSDTSTAAGHVLLCYSSQGLRMFPVV